MPSLRGAAVGLLFASLPFVSIGCASLSPRLNVLPSVAKHRAESQYQAARNAEQQGQFSKARELYAALQRQSPNTPVYAHRMGVVCIQLQDFETAGKYFEHARGLDPKNPALLADMGYSAYLQKEYASSEALLRESVHLNPEDPRAINNLAMAIGYQGRYDESLATFRRANPETQALLNVAFVQSQRDDLQTARTTYERVLSGDPSNKIATRALQILVAEQQTHAVKTAVAVADPVPTQPNAEVEPPEVSIHPAWETAAVPPSASPPENTSEVPLAIAPDENLKLLPSPIAISANDAAAVPPTQSQWTPTQSVASIADTPEEVFELPERTVADVAPTLSTADAREAISSPVEPLNLTSDDSTQEPIETVSEPVVELLPAPGADDLSDALAGDDTAPEPTSADMEELAVLDWAHAKLEQDKIDIEAGTKASPLDEDCLRGYCPVALRDERRLAPALEEFEAEFQEQTYRFSSSAARDKFLQHPHWYAPVEHGRDVIQVRSGQVAAAGTLDHACWFRHRLHMFSTADNLETFRASPRAFVVP